MKINSRIIPLDNMPTVAILTLGEMVERVLQSGGHFLESGLSLLYTATKCFHKVTAIEHGPWSSSITSICQPFVNHVRAG